MEMIWQTGFENRRKLRVKFMVQYQSEVFLETYSLCIINVKYYLYFFKCCCPASYPLVVTALTDQLLCVVR